MTDEMSAAEYNAQFKPSRSKTKAKDSLEEFVVEKDLRQSIVDAAVLLNWKVYFTWNSLHSPAGFPDLCMVRDDRLIFAELKTEAGKLRPEQEAWLEALSEFPGVETYVWRPADLSDALILLGAA